MQRLIDSLEKRDNEEFIQEKYLAFEILPFLQGFSLAQRSKVWDYCRLLSVEDNEGQDDNPIEELDPYNIFLQETYKTIH